MAKITSVSVNSFKKVQRIMKELKKQGRICTYETFFNMDCSRTYYICYRTV